MKLVDLTCNHCGALLKVDVDKKQATCNYCGATILIDDGVQQSNSIGMQVRQGYVPNQPSKEKKGTCWRVLLWVFFFPIMLTIFIIKTDRLKLPIKIVLIVLLWIFFMVVGVMDNTGDKTDTDMISTNIGIDAEETNDETEQSIITTEKSEGNSTEEETLVEKDIENKESETNTEEGEGIRNENLNGRGGADSGRSEPQYVNVIGYVVVGYDQNYELEHTDNFENTDLWVIPTYEQDKQFWNDTGVIIPHKTEVIVREQILSHEGYGAYSGYLLVENLEDGKQYYINVNNFVTKPYWTYSDDLRSAALTGDFIAVYHQVSDYYPITNGGDKAEIEDGKVVLVNGVAGLSRNVNPDETGIDAVVWQEWRLGYGDVTVHFNAEDLTIIY